MSDIILRKINDVFIKVIADPGIIMEMSGEFTFDVDGARFSPLYRNKVWDGKIRLLNTLTCQVYSGLYEKIEEFARKRDYTLEYEFNNADSEFSVKEAVDFIATLNLKDDFEIRDYQLKAFVQAVRKKRGVFVSPTASGKSFIIYLLCRYFNLKTLIVVPTLQLVHQMYSDFADYGYDVQENMYKVYAGQDKNNEAKICVSTWQSIVDEKSSFFNQFDVIIGDEAHTWKAKSLKKIMEKLVDCKYKIGTTGTLDDIQVNELVLEGLFGPIYKVTTTSELQKQGYVSRLKIKILVLQYNNDVRKVNCKLEYQDEIKYLTELEARNRFIRNLALSLKGNTIILFTKVEKHGKILYNELKKEIEEGRALFYVSGEVKGEIREDIRKKIENEENGIIVASYGTFSTGTNIKNVNNIIFASPYKSKIKVLQSIGRVLRLHKDKEFAVLFDIADDMSWKSTRNTTLNHLFERVKSYSAEKFEFKTYNVELKT